MFGVAAVGKLGLRHEARVDTGQADGRRFGTQIDAENAGAFDVQVQVAAAAGRAASVPTAPSVTQPSSIS